MAAKERSIKNRSFCKSRMERRGIVYSLVIYRILEVPISFGYSGWV